MPEQSRPRTWQSLGAPLDGSQTPYVMPGVAPCPPAHAYGVPISPQALFTAVLACAAAPDCLTPQLGAAVAGAARPPRTTTVAASSASTGRTTADRHRVVLPIGAHLLRCIRCRDDRSI